MRRRNESERAEKEPTLDDLVNRVGYLLTKNIMFTSEYWKSAEAVTALCTYLDAQEAVTPKERTQLAQLVADVTERSKQPTMSGAEFERRFVKQMSFDAPYITEENHYNALTARAAEMVPILRRSIERVSGVKAVLPIEELGE